VSFDKNVTAITVDPAMLLPMGVRAWRLFPAAGFPVVSRFVPAVVAVYPHIISSWCATTVLDDDARWRYPDNDLRREA
jgi:hypothetical protein